ncbi:MAG: histidine ammonia-lyase [Ectothiorhodospiraceae bacterium]|nr:histidine ammonia-lyase [Ectothiorhodospiraceae bacterium]
MSTLYLDGNSLTIHDVWNVANGSVQAELAESAISKMQASRALVESWVKENKVMYGVTTGFGEFSNVSITQEDLHTLQVNLIQSHAVGCGEPIPKEVTRALMLLRANALAKGYSGIRIETVELLLTMLNRDIIPVIPSQGSVGSSGDLAQLSHLVLGMMAEGSCWAEDGIHRPAMSEKFEKHGLEPVQLGAKEGLALINGTQMMSAYLCMAVHRAGSLAKQFDIAGTMTLEALLGTDKASSPHLHAARPHEGQQRVARNILALIADSQLRESHRHDHDVVQDAYSLRCMPQVHGASRDAIGYVVKVLETEINSATDNPLIFPDTGELIEGGNFHGQPLALAGDFLGIALSELANISERRIERMVNGKLSGLPRFLTSKGGLNSGLMISQYTAAALVSENKVLAHPASVDSIPTSANQEDHNSMGSIAARKAYQIMKNVESVLTIEYMTASQALDFHLPKQFGKGTTAAHRTVRNVVEHHDTDRILHRDMDTIRTLVQKDTVLDAVEKEIGTLE